MHVLRTAKAWCTRSAMALAVAVLLLWAAAPAHAKYASIIIDGDSGTVLHAVNADTRNYPASLTKMMTLYLLFEALEAGELTLNSPITMTARAVRQPPSRLGLAKGESITVDEAIRVLVIKSANDVAVAIAETLAKSERAFAQTMTQKARALGMTRTTFRNASGLPNQGQLSTARDLAVLAMAVREHFPRYKHYFAEERVRVHGKTYRTHNDLLHKLPGADGMKTGYIRASGFNVATSVTQGQRHLYGVVLGGRTAKQRDNHMVTLVSRGFANLTLDPQTVAMPLPRPGSKAAIVLAATEPELLSGARHARPLDERARAFDVAALDDRGPVEGMTEQGSAPDRAAPAEPWEIQVGAFASRHAARNALEHAQAITGADLGIVVSSVGNGRGTLYRARLTAASYGAAEDACAALEARHMPCFVVTD